MTSIEDIVDQLDEEYYLSQAPRVSNYFNNTFEKIIINNNDILKNIDKPLILVPTHTTELDQLLVGLITYDITGKIMKFLGGSNLLINGITKPVMGITKLMDIRKAGMITIDRGHFSSDNFQKSYKEVIRQQQPLTNPIFACNQDGRSKNGQYGREFPRIIRKTAQYILKNHANVCILPISISLDRVFEDWTFSWNSYFKGIARNFDRNLNKILPWKFNIAKKLAGATNALMDIYSMLYESGHMSLTSTLMLLSSTKNKNTKPHVYFNIGNPIVYTKSDDFSNLGKKIKKSHLKNSTATALGIKSYSEKNKIPIEKILDYLYSKNVKLGVNCENEKNILYYSQKLIPKLNETLLDYYANTIVHHLR